MATQKYNFNEEDTVKILLWCARHCCLCGKFAGVRIEIAHLVQKSSDIDDAIPLCFDCHAEIGHYREDHPKGRKYSIKEVKAHRDRVYEEHTRHLLPPVDFRLKQAGRTLPDVGFEISNLGDMYPVQARIKIYLRQGARTLQPIELDHYNGKYLWNLNPRFVVNVHFSIPSGISINSEERIRAMIEVTLIDIYKREHNLLPMGYIHTSKPQDDWYFEPSMEALDII